MRHHILGTVAIPEDVWWSDEFAWNPVAQATTRSLTGARLVQLGVKLKGRPITLASSERGGWVTRGTVLSLRALADVPGATYTLTLADGRTFTVAFDADRDFIAAPVRPAADMTDASKYRVTLPLIEV
ncbi:hypothetical protein ebB249 [Aromatoleum aromaticum EbN1]|uniref:Uncharacterized protein n=1 Tax=Aromatoleum aromaticum (strain DSM 19018 / LMG 30748 / EbN1) TaxID=76114 RepID=Q5NXI2_AROAE|nr:hypothetical protein [Aromatoleum aromaticum]CAI10232.1 hypothetical protein ebB249 [Aromatoleum aromaticum EbN1]